jgi:hypothetical protein
MLLCIRLVGKNLQKPHDSCIVSGRETEGVMRRRTRSRPQFGGLSTGVPFIVARRSSISVQSGLLLRSFFSRLIDYINIIALVKSKNNQYHNKK